MRHIIPGVATATLAFLLTACTPEKMPAPNPRYTLGPAWQANGVWWYPAETYDLNETGLAAIIPDPGKARLTADGEPYDPTALAAAHPTVQLPAIATLTNLENGRQITVRLNDRGTGDPRRLLQVTPRVAALLLIPSNGVVRVRLHVLPVESHAAADSLPGAPSLNLAAAPRASVEVAELPPPQGVRQGAAHMLANTAVATRADAPQAPPPSRLPETIIQTQPDPGHLMLHLDTFSEYQYAAIQRAKMSAFGARIVQTYEGRTHRFRVEVGPLPDIPGADAALLQALNAGIHDARIVVD